jgi:hypothetical protein
MPARVLPAKRYSSHKKYIIHAALNDDGFSQVCTVGQRCGSPDLIQGCNVVILKNIKNIYKCINSYVLL